MDLNQAYNDYLREAREARIAAYGHDPLAHFSAKTIHYAPYGKNAAGKYECGSSEGGYSKHPNHVTCLGCMQQSPGLWPNLTPAATEER